MIPCNTQGVPLGPRGYVVCTVCGKEVTEISREVVREYAQCLSHQRAQLITGGRMTKVKREKKVRVKGEPVPAIKWFQDQAAHTKDPETITKAAEKHEYSPNTITIQLGRLRGMGLIPVVDKMVKEKKVRVLKPKMDKKTAKAKSFHPVPKPGQKEAV